MRIEEGIEGHASQLRQRRSEGIEGHASQLRAGPSARAGRPERTIEDGAGRAAWMLNSR